MPRDKQKASSRMDMTMLTLVILLTVFGLVILLSASEYNGRVRFHDSAYYFKKQLFASALGLSAMYFVSSIDYHFFVRLAPAAYLLSMLLSTADFQLRASCFLPTADTPARSLIFSSLKSARSCQAHYSSQAYQPLYLSGNHLPFAGIKKTLHLHLDAGSLFLWHAALEF